MLRPYRRHSTKRWSALACTLAVTMPGCWRGAATGIDYVVPQPSETATTGAVMLSAQFSYDAARDHAPEDAIVVVFDRPLDAASLTAGAFMVVLSDGGRLRATGATLAPASEADENRTVTLFGEFGGPGGPQPTDVVVIDRIFDEQGGPLLGASAKVTEHGAGPRVVAVVALPSSSACGGASQVVRTYWSDTVLDVDDADLARVELVLADGSTVHPRALDDVRTNGTDVLDDNVIDLCVAEAAQARTLRVPAGAFMGPAGGRSEAALARIAPPA